MRIRCAPAPAGHLPLSGCCAPGWPRRRCQACATRRRFGRNPSRCSRAPAAPRVRAPRRRSTAGRDAGADTSNEHEPPMPARERFRPHHECLPRTARQHPTERREQQPVAGLKPRPFRLPAQDQQLMTQHEDLQFLRALAAPEQNDQLEQPADDDVHERQAQGRPPQDGLPTLPRHQQSPSHNDRRGRRPSFCSPRVPSQQRVRDTQTTSAIGPPSTTTRAPNYRAQRPESRGRVCEPYGPHR